jgi:hypothetical protein
MKLKALVMTLAAAAVAVSAAVAAPSHKPPKPGKNTGAGATQSAKPCKGKMLSLSGSFVSGSADSSGVGSFAMLVKHANRAGRRLGLVGTQASLNVDARTRYRRQGKVGLADLQPKDRLLVVARACKAQDSTSTSDGSGQPGSDQPSNPTPTGKHHGKPEASAPTTPPTLVARLVVAHAPKSDGGGDTTTGDTGTTGTTTDQQDTGTTGTTTDGSGS